MFFRVSLVGFTRARTRNIKLHNPPVRSLCKARRRRRQTTRVMYLIELQCLRGVRVDILCVACRCASRIYECCERISNAIRSAQNAPSCTAMQLITSKRHERRACARPLRRILHRTQTKRDNNAHITNKPPHLSEGVFFCVATIKCKHH